LSDTEWRAQFISPDGAPAGDPIGEAIVVARNNAKSFADINEIIQRALKKINDSQVRNIGTVSIVLSDPGITLLDNVDGHFSYGNVAKIRQYGVESLHCDEVSYGFSPFGTAKFAAPPNSRAEHGVFGFADVVVLRRYLGQLDRLAIKTVLIAPVAQNTIFDAQSNPDDATCGGSAIERHSNEMRETRSPGLFHNFGAMGFNRPMANLKQTRNFFVGHTRNQQI